MGLYDDIQIPVQGQPISSAGFGIKARDAILDIDTRLAILEANSVLPAAASGFGNGVNNLAGGSNVWTTLPDFPISVPMTNPNTDFDLVVDVYYGGWMQTSAGTVRMGVALSGGMTVATGTPGANQPAGYAMFPHTNATFTDQHMGFFQVIIPKTVNTAVNFVGYGMRTVNTAAAQVNYPTIHLVPRRYQ